jgi:hypothetical protein
LTRSGYLELVSGSFMWNTTLMITRSGIMKKIRSNQVDLKKILDGLESIFIGILFPFLTNKAKD